jgi:protein-tyrosine phosphatase
LLGQHQLPLVQASRYNTIFYLDWSINFPPHFKLIPEVFHSMRQILADNGTRLLVHCKNGTDRTALALFGYLMFNGYDEQDALAKLDARKGTDGNPIMNVSANNSYPAFRQMFEAWLLVANVT